MKKNIKKSSSTHKEEHHEHKVHSSKGKACSMKDSFWQITSFVLLILLVVAAVFAFTGNNKVEDVTCNENVGEETRSFLIEAFQLPSLDFKTTVTSNNMCLHTFSIEGQDIDIYTSYDGEVVFVPGLEPINKSTFVAPENETPEEVELQKTEKPVVELFVMSHCPYGTQVEKGILPAVDALGDSIDFEVKFVNYVMHDLVEVEEQLLQYCIQESSKEVYKEYLYCFLEDGNTDRCLEKTGVTRDSLSECIAQTDETYNVMGSYLDKSSWLSGVYPKFLIHDEDNLKYNVRGSPTLVINGTVVESSRDPQSLLNAICNGFETLPRACNEALSTASPTPGFGFSGTSTTSTDATCG